MLEHFVVNAQARADVGKGASRRLRRAGLVPAIIYGSDTDPEMLSLEHREIVKHLEEEAFYSHILTIKAGGSEHKAVLKDLQRHPYKPQILHVDFLRVGDEDKIRMHVPLHFINENVAPGVKLAGGLVSHLMNNAEIICKAKDLPEYLEIDLAHLEAGASVHLSDIKLPEGVELVALLQGADHDLSVATIHIARGAASNEGDEPAAEE